jgi:dihydrofolate reductase
MATVFVALTMSLDGFVAGPDDGPAKPLGEGGERLFDWYFDGDTPIRQYREAAGRGVPVPPFALSHTSAEVFESLVEETGAVVTGRRTYDITNGWNGNGPLPGRPLFVVTHRVPGKVPTGEARYTFVTGGVAEAVTRAGEAAGDRAVSLMGASVPQECLRAGLVDELRIHLVPVLLGSGTRLFDRLGGVVRLEQLGVVDAPGVTHLRYRVIR